MPIAQGSAAPAGLGSRGVQEDPCPGVRSYPQVTGSLVWLLCRPVSVRRVL